MCRTVNVLSEFRASLIKENLGRKLKVISTEALGDTD